MDPVPTIRLLSLDFDGTLLDYPPEGAILHAEAIDLLNELGDRGVQWCVNSGRSFSDQFAIVEASRAAGLRNLPNALLCMESLIYEREGGTIRALEPWNSEMTATLRDLQEQVSLRIGPRVDAIRDRYTDDIYLNELYSAFNVPDVNDLPLALERELKEWLDGVPGAHVTRNGCWVAVISTRAGKGNVLTAFGRRAGFTREEILAVGDHMNDLPMLDGKHAAYVGCPGNAVFEVKDAVRGAGGLVASEHGPLGTVEVIRAFCG